MKKVLAVLSFCLLLVSCSKNDDVNDEFSILDKWAESSLDKTYLESEHISFIEFRGNMTGKCTFDGTIYKANGPSTWEFKYTFDKPTNKLTILSNDPNDPNTWTGTVIFIDKNTFEWSNSILHKLN